MGRRITNLPACYGVLAIAALEVNLRAGPVRVCTRAAGELTRLNALLEDPAVTRWLVITSMR